MIFKNGYHVENGVVYWNATPLKGADAATFHSPNDYWAMDRTHVWTLSTRRRGIDRSSFEVLNNLFAKDKDAVYTIEGKVEDADPASFEVLGPATDGLSTHARDCNRAYHLSYSDPSPTVLRGADPATFRALANEWARDEKKVWHTSNRLVPFDAARLRLLGEMYATDEKRVYYASHCIEDADPATFEVVDKLIARDRTRVYSQNYAVDLDPKTLRVIAAPNELNGSSYYCDASCVYHMRSAIPKAHAPSFMHLADFYCVDRLHVYRDGKRIRGAKAQSFIYLGEGYAKDARRFYFHGTVRRPDQVPAHLRPVRTIKRGFVNFWRKIWPFGS